MTLIDRLEAETGPDKTTLETIRKIRAAFADCPKIIAILKAKEDINAED